MDLRGAIVREAVLAAEERHGGLRARGAAWARGRPGWHPDDKLGGVMGRNSSGPQQLSMRLENGQTIAEPTMATVMVTVDVCPALWP